MRALRNLARGTDTVVELLQFLWAQRLWWLIPFVILLLLTAALVLVGQVTGAGPFVYTLF
jgi:hypothetical protein